MERDLAGHTIANRYDILGLIGRGGMGAVYRAHDRELDELVAFKVIRPDRTSSSMLEGFRQEVKLARRVTHTNVARTFELGVDTSVSPPIMFCTMELVEGESLRDRLRTGAMPLGQAVAIAHAMCEGLAMAHAAGVIHRDIKPDNVLLGSDGRVVIVDFGVAALTVTDHRGMSGTLEYMAPEQMHGEVPTVACDVYAVGVVLYEMLTGIRAFTGNTTEIIVAKSQTERLTFDVADLIADQPTPAGLAELVGRATVREPANRIATARELARELVPWLGGAEVSGAQRPAPAIETVVVLAPHAAGDPGSLHIADGIHGRLLHRLVSRPRLRVLPRVAGAAVPDDATTVALHARGSVLAVDIRRADHPDHHFEIPLELRTIDAAVEMIAHAVTHVSDSTDDPAQELLLRARVASRYGFSGGDEALALLRQANELAPDDWMIAAELAALLSRLYLFRDPDFEGTRGFITSIRERAPELAASRIASAYLHLHLGEPGVAASEFRAAITCSPYHAGGHEGIGRMLLEAGFLADAVSRLDDALAIAPDLVVVRWELARAHALEQNWVARDQIVADLPPGERKFERMRHAWWRGDREQLERYCADHTPVGFAAQLVTTCYDLALGGSWAAHRDAVVTDVRTEPSKSNRAHAFKAQIAAELAGYAGDAATAIAMIELAIDHKFYDLHWYDRCPNLEIVRRAPEHPLLRAEIALRADAILDALYGDKA